MVRRTVKIDGVIIETHEVVEGEEGWIELAYEAGAIEFTILQISFHGDWLVSKDNLQAILDHATQLVTKTH